MLTRWTGSCSDSREGKADNSVNKQLRVKILIVFCKLSFKPGEKEINETADLFAHPSFY